MQTSDFVIDGVPYAKVLYLEGNVWIRPPGATFHRLTEDEPIPAQSVIYTGFNGTLDFATGPGMAARMVPGTLLVVDQLPQVSPPAVSASTPVSPATSAPAQQAPVSAPLAATIPPSAVSVVDVKKGTVFSALGRDDGQPIDFRVRTPEGVAGAKGTMFSTSTSGGQSQVDMLHGTVNFQTPDQQTSQITAGQSQQISTSAGNRYRFGQRQNLNPASSETFFNHAGGLLEHASGYGVVRHGLGPDIARTLQERGYRLPAAMQQRFQNAGRFHYQHRPVFNRAHAFRPAGAGAAGVRATETPHPNLNNRPLAPAYRPAANDKNHAPLKKDEADRRRRRGE